MYKHTIIGLTIAIALSGCAHMGSQGGGAKAVATIAPTVGNAARGTVTFVQMGSKVRVTAEVSGLKPGAEHGFHIHEKNDCSGDGTKTGGHFNPGGKPHAHHSSSERHAGDMPALKANEHGVAKATFDLDLITVDEGPFGILNRGVIVHKDPDDYKTQPTGNAGARIGCGVIKKS